MLEFSFAMQHSHKVYSQGSLYPDIRVPMREQFVEGNPSVFIYDTSGPYTDPSVTTT